MYRGVDQKRPLEPPLHILLGYVKEGSRIRILINQNSKMYYEGTFVGFDEFMNLVLNDTFEIYIKDNSKLSLGTLMLRGDTISIIHQITK